MREEAVRSNDPERMQMWAGQAARFARPEPAGVIVQELWGDARQYLR
jgi:nitronate monooxygenase